MEVILWIIIIIGAILNGLLFWKVWGMTNDVSELKNELCSNKRLIFPFQLNKKVIVLKYSGKIEEAKKLLDKNLESEIFQSITPGRPTEIQRKVERVINKYEKYYNCLNCEMPDEMKNIDVAKILDEYSSLCRTV